ncbi:MAG: hypothetical protein HRU20_19720 [Pseudomonadales bacterium]|nr:hypothetical protein [Pseudomonadales bacterium]
MLIIKSLDGQTIETDCPQMHRTVEKMQGYKAGSDVEFIHFSSLTDQLRDKATALSLGGADIYTKSGQWLTSTEI